MLRHLDGEATQRRAVEVTEHAIYRLEPVERRRILVKQLAQERRAAAHVRHDDHLGYRSYNKKGGFYVEKTL